MQVSRLIKIFSLGVLLMATNALAKPGAAIGLTSPTNYKLDPYSNTQITVNFELTKSANSIQILMQTKGNVSVVSPSLNQTIALSSKQSTLSFPVELESAEAGVSYLMFNLILTYENGRTEARSLGLRLQVGEAENKEKLGKPANKGGIKELPAQETIR